MQAMHAIERFSKIVYMYAYIHTYMHACIHTYIHTYIPLSDEGYERDQKI